MKRQVMNTLSVLLAAVILAGCGQLPKEEVGAVVGAGLGGLAGSLIGDGGGKLVAIGVGTMLGAIIGGETGKSLDRADKLALAQAQHEALENGESGSTTAWVNPDSGNSGEIVPQPAYQEVDGTYCREFQQTIIVGAEMQAAYGTACRQPDGTWKLS
ncbi:MAG: RT0821/Lpp0805 family surface protein [Candidatus Tectomicrobia bacterium]|nr:RT0821/Lpp0805 family surface protein [Candidatus Tectomicrobia bacterium]